MLGWALGPSPVARYSLSRRLIDYAGAFLVSFTGVVTPTFASLQARGEEEQLRRLFILGGRLCSALGFLFVGFAFLFGGPFLALWLGERWASYAPLLWILAVGEALPMSQSITGNMLLGVARHHRLAMLLVVEVVLIMAGTTFVAQWEGLRGVCILLAAGAFLFRGVLVLGLGCRAVEMPVHRYLAQAIAPSLAVSSAVVAATRVVVILIPPSGWGRFLLDLGAYTLLSAPALALLGGPTLIRAARDWVRPREGG
jgi:O-antigen/teichoic acid export membrane protein